MSYGSSDQRLSWNCMRQFLRVYKGSRHCKYWQRSITWLILSTLHPIFHSSVFPWLWIWNQPSTALQWISCRPFPPAPTVSSYTFARCICRLCPCIRGTCCDPCARSARCSSGAQYSWKWALFTSRGVVGKRQHLSLPSMANISSEYPSPCPSLHRLHLQKAFMYSIYSN